MTAETQTQTEIKGVTTENTTGPYGEKGCDETMHVVHNGEDVYVPFTNVRASGYDYYGDVPEKFDVDRIVEYMGNIHAEADVDGGIVELVPDYKHASAEIRGYDKWELHKFYADAPSSGTVIYERD